MAIYAEESQVKAGVREWSMYQVLDNQQVTASSTEVDVRNAEAISMVVQPTAGTTGGAVVLEGSVTSGYTGVWILLDTVTITAGGRQLLVVASDTADFPIKYVRARVSTALTGGNCDAWIVVQR